MRFRVTSFAGACLVLASACSDPAPNYPPIVINIITGGGTGNTGNTGTGNTGNTGTGNRSNGGTGNGPGGGGSNAGTGNGGNVDPLYAHCNEFNDVPEPAVQTACDLDALEDGGELKGAITTDRTLTSGKFYTLVDGVTVEPGVTLTIEPCVKVIGASPDAILLTKSSTVGNPKRSCSFTAGQTITEPPGKLVAVGEPMAPIVFTSAKPVGQRAPGDWGGVLLLGNARNDLANATTRVPVEGLASAECHGFHTDEHDDESSGHLEYVRIEYASRQVAANSETNSLTFGSVGSGTIVSHVMVTNSADDCFEWFGGTVNADHLVALNCDDDMFDADNGFRGRLQFLFGRQFTTTTEADSRGMELDTGSGTKQTFTTVGISNFTLCGGGPTDTEASRQGLVIRSEAKPTLANGFITGFAGEGYVNDTASGSVVHTRIFGQAVLGAVNSIPLFLAGEGNSAEDPDRFCDCWANPPAPIPATAVSGATPTGFDDDTADFLGAFGGPQDNWMKGAWVDWSFE